MTLFQAGLTGQAQRSVSLCEIGRNAGQLTRELMETRDPPGHGDSV